MTIEALIRAVPPPAMPWEPFAGPWGPVEAELGTPLPQDYKDFVRLYGRGYFMEFLGVHVPGSRNPNCRLEAKVPAICRSFAGYDDDNELPYPLWPAPDGLLPFGQTDNGDYLFWVMRGAPDDWRVVVWDRGFLGFEELDCDITGFLAGLATGAIIPKQFPDDLVVCEHLFQPDHKPIADQKIRFPLTYTHEPGAVEPPRVAFQLTWKLGGFMGSSASRLRKGG